MHSLRIHEACGVFGMYHTRGEGCCRIYQLLWTLLSAASRTESWIAVFDTCDSKGNITTAALGLVNEVFQETELKQLKGTLESVMSATPPPGNPH